MAVKRLGNTKIQYDDGNGVLASSYRLFFYAAGSSTKQNTYNSSTGGVANANPIVLNALGEPASEIWLTAGLSYKVGLAIPGSDDPPAAFVWTEDNIAGVNDTTTQADEWVGFSSVPTFVSATSFTLVGDQTTEFHVGRRLKTINSGGTVYGTIITTAFGALTTVTVANDSGVLDAGLSAVSYGLIRANNPSVSPQMVYRKGAAVASAGTTNIWGIVGDYVHITGTTGITSLGTAPYAGAQRMVVFDGALTLTHNATTLVLPGGQNITTAANDIAIVRADTTANMVVVSYVRASGVPVVGTQAANTAFAGPISGAAAVPAFRLLTGADGASRVSLSKKTLTGASIQFTSADFDWTAYDYYEFAIYQAVPATNGAGINVTVSEDAGSSYLAGTHYNRTFLGQDSGGTARNVTGQNEALWQFPETAVSGISNSATNNGFDGVLTLWKPSAALRHHASLRDGAYFPGATANMAMITGAMLVIGTPAALTGIKFAPSTGNWTSGTVAVYGHRTV